MSETDTPRTDEVIVQMIPDSHYDDVKALLLHARTLERELTLREQLKAANARIKKEQAEYVTSLHQVNDEWQKVVDEWKQRAEQAEAELAKYRRSVVEGEKDKKDALKRWLVFDVGCIECGEDSRVIGVFATEEEAAAAAKSAKAEQEKNWRGQHSFEVFDLALAAGEGK